MFDVLAIRTVLFIKLSPVLGSLSSGNSLRTSVISFPRSPQPTYTTISVSPHLATWCWTTVLPAPNGPGTAAAPPLATGKNVSITLWPVVIGASGFNFLAYGLPFLAGHFCINVNSLSPFSVSTTHTVSTIVNSPALISFIVPFTP